MVKTKWNYNAIEEVINDAKFKIAKEVAVSIVCPICGKNPTVNSIDGDKIYYDYCHNELELLVKEYLKKI